MMDDELRKLESEFVRAHSAYVSTFQATEEQIKALDDAAEKLKAAYKKRGENKKEKNKSD